MFRYFTHITAMLLIAAVLLGLALSCVDDDNPVKPPPDDADTVDYIAYFADGSHPYTYFAYHTETGTVDSFTLPYKSDNGFAVSPDGTTMYLSTGNAIVSVDLDSRAVIGEYAAETHGRQASISPDGTYLAITDNHLKVFRLPDMSVVYQDTGGSFNGVFSSDSKTFYCAAFDYNRELFALRVELSNPMTIDSIHFSDGGAWLIVPNNTEGKWFVFLSVHLDLFIFEVYDASDDSVIYRQGIAPGFGDMALTPGGEYLVFSQRGSMNSNVPPPSYFTIFDVKENRIYKEVSTEGIQTDTALSYLPIGDLCLTPDGRWIIGTRAIAGGELFAFDMRRMEFGDYVFLGHNKILTNLTCQSSP